MAVSSLVSCSLSNCRTSASPTMYVPSRFWCPEPIPYSHPNLRYRNGVAAMSLVLAADYRVRDFDHWWATIAGDLARLPDLGVHIVVVYRSLQDATPVFVTIGVRERGPVDALLRSPVMFSWFDSAGVDEIPPMFAGEIVEKLDLTPETQDASPAAGGPAVGVPAAGGPAAAGAVNVAAIAAVGRLDRLRASVHAAVP